MAEYAAIAVPARRGGQAAWLLAVVPLRLGWRSSALAAECAGIDDAGNDGQGVAVAPRRCVA
jgi:hypothetical protein